MNQEPATQEQRFDLPNPTRVMTLFYRMNALFLVVGSIGVGVLGWLALSQLAENIRKNPEVRKDIAPFALQCIERRGLLPVFVLPLVVCGLIVLVAGRTRGPYWIMVTLCNLILFALFGVVLYSFIMFVAPLYEYHPL